MITVETVWHYWYNLIDIYIWSINVIDISYLIQYDWLIYNIWYNMIDWYIIFDQIRLIDISYLIKYDWLVQYDRYKIDVLEFI
jgi:hypothetical protein